MSEPRIHLIGIGGVGMAGLAVLLKARGACVTGCDLHPGPRTAWLEGLGIRVFAGHDPAHVAGQNEVIVTPAVRAGTPELDEAAGRVRFRGEVLAELVSAAPDSIAVCGSHGKTTTATWIVRLLCALGEDPSWAIGGESGDFPVAGVGSGVLVVEADESDGTLARYHAKTLVVTNCEYDHPDHFKTRADYLACYDAAMANAMEVIEEPTEPQDLADQVSLASLGLAPHNQRNALMAVEVARRRGHDLKAIAAALPDVISLLPDRRFQKLSEGVYTDYAHHPTEIACAIGMARTICRGKVRVLFQPHRYSRTKALIADFPPAFSGVDELVLCPTYAAFEEPVEGGDIADLYAACRSTIPVKLARTCEEGWTHLMRTRLSEDIILVLGAGDLIQKLHEVAPSHYWIGAGTNTWVSDLNLPVTYEKTKGPAGEAGAAVLARHPTLMPWMAGIPGTMGGWIKMNAGAFGHSISEVLDAVQVDDVWMSAANCGFSYRHSEIRGEIQDYRLIDESRQEAEPETTESYRARRKSFPSGTFGSVFKNPPADHAGRLLEAVGAKELRVGGAYVWSEHANVIVRGEGATASDVLALARLMMNRVRFRLGVTLEPEVCGLIDNR